MADIDVVIQNVPDATGGTVALKKKFVDQGDGTYAEKVAAELVVGDVTIGEVDQGAAGADPWAVVGPNVSVASAFAGQKTVTTPGTAVQLSATSVPLTNGIWIKGLAANTGVVYVWYATGDGRTGFELSAKEVVPVQVADLNQIWIDAAVGGEGICWIKG